MTTTMPRKSAMHFPEGGSGSVTEISVPSADDPSADQAVLSPGNTRHTLKESRSAFDDSYALAGCHGSGRAGLEDTKPPMALAVLGRLSCTHHLLAANSRHRAALWVSSTDMAT